MGQAEQVGAICADEFMPYPKIDAASQNLEIVSLFQLTRTPILPFPLPPQIRLQLTGIFMLLRSLCHTLAADSICCLPELMIIDPREGPPRIVHACLNDIERELVRGSPAFCPFARKELLTRQLVCGLHVHASHPGFRLLFFAELPPDQVRRGHYGSGRLAS